MSRYIDVDVAINLAKEEIDSGTPNDIAWKLEALPIADVVEAVRCRDCKHRPIIIEEEEIDGFSYEFPDYKCPCRCEDGFFSWNPDDDWFCANGEKEGKMARYIDADALLEILRHEEEYNADIHERADGIRDAIMDVLEAPTADVVERKKGEWVSLNGWITCSECGCEPPNETNIESDFCPNCGAEMRGEKDG